MIFGETPLERAEGAILAHSLRPPGGAALKKGRVLSAEDVAALAAAGIGSVVAARLEPGDVGEDAAALRIARALAPDPAGARLTLSDPVGGRVNLHAAEDGLFEIAPALVAALNNIDESVTLATLESPTWAPARAMLATVKIIPFAAPEAAVAEAERIAAAADAGRPRLFAAIRPKTRLILTRTPGFSAHLLEKGAAAIRARLAALKAPLTAEETVPHRAADLSAALRDGDEALTLILGAAATTDRRDVAPAAIEAAGGTLERLGMPVDPGNLLALGRIGGRAVVVLPGCARSPKLNGADWALRRLAAGRPLGAAEIAGMGHGGLLQEIPSRPAPRLTRGDESAQGGAPRISGVLLAAGGARRMGPGRHKLLEEIDGVPQIRRAAAALLGSGLSETVVVLGAAARETGPALEGLALRRVENPAWESGMGASLAAALRAIAPEADAVLIALADMPLMAPALIDRLITAFDPAAGAEIVRPLGAGGRPGHPILFGRRFFEALSRIEGDQGARAVIAEHPEFLREVAIGGRAPLLDLDTPEDWARFRAE